jgi:CHASE2 domain-containing sensor protein
MSRTIDVLAEAQPKVIALDVLYADASSAGDDSALAKAVARAGNVVVFNSFGSGMCVVARGLRTCGQSVLRAG